MRAGLKLQIFPNGEALALAVAREIAKTAAATIAAKGVFRLVLAGGSTPRRCYELLRDMAVDWTQVHIYFGDERCLPAGDAGRNDVMADASLLAHVPVPAQQIHRIPAEQGPEKGAARYGALLSEAPPMDLVLLGMGEDGHTASLFPGNPALEADGMAVPVFDSPKPPPQRISMGYSALNAARRRIILVSGHSKEEALHRVMAGEALPVARLAEGDWFVDEAAIRDGR